MFIEKLPVPVLNENSKKIFISCVQQLLDSKEEFQSST
jgi:hypothetical protein